MPDKFQHTNLYYKFYIVISAAALVIYLGVIENIWYTIFRTDGFPQRFSANIIYFQNSANSSCTK